MELDRSEKARRQHPDMHVAGESDSSIVPEKLANNGGVPSPAELAFREDGVKVTLALSKSSVEFFKSEASKHHTQYQRMIRRLLDSYVEAQGAAASKAKGTERKRAPI
jgi:hypothetical protein